MAKDPICGMFVEEKSNSIRHESGGKNYYFCSSLCLQEFTQPEKELHKLKSHVVISLILTIPIVAISLPHMTSGLIPSFLPMHLANYMAFVLATPIQFWIGWRFYRGLWDGIRTRASNMDTLIALGTTSAYVYSTIVTFIPEFFPVESVYFESASIIITLILLGRLMESKTKEKASSAVRKLLDLQSRKAKVLRNNTEIEIPIEEVQQGDVLLTRPGEKIATDGIIIDGISSIDESAITGESIPVDKGVGDQVIGSTINKSGLLKIKATKIGQDTVLSQIISLVEEAKTGKTKMQRTVDQVAKYFVPAVIVIALASGFTWYLIGGVDFDYSLLAFVSVIIIACPCALGIATPAALMMGTGKGAEYGILFKGGEHLEIAKNIDTIVFDKTGTITEGKPTVTDIVDVSGIGKKELIRLAAIAESGSEHPLAQAIINKAKESDSPIPNPESFEAIPGHGLKATYAGHVILIGTRRLIEQNKVPVNDETENIMKNLEIEGKTVILTLIDGKIAGIIAISDTIKKTAKEAIELLKKNKMEVIILTGDNERTANAIASQIGIEKVISQVLPNEKEKVISDLKNQGKIVAMVGDGINDAPALASADLGIAIGSGTDIAKETGGIILIKNDLRDVYVALSLGRKTVAKIKQNLFWSFAYNTGLIPVAAGVLVPLFGLAIFSWLPILAGVAMATSSLTVVGNSLLLGRFKPIKG